MTSEPYQQALAASLDQLHAHQDPDIAAQTQALLKLSRNGGAGSTYLARLEGSGALAQGPGAAAAGAGGIAILEVADALRARGYEVDLSPKPIFQDPGQRWGRRARPDLVARKGDRWWPVEVQRKVAEHPRYREKWAKTLRLSGRLMLVLFSEEKLAQQRRLLLAWSQHRDWPTGQVLLASLERMTDDPAGWTFQSLD